MLTVGISMGTRWGLTIAVVFILQLSTAAVAHAENKSVSSDAGPRHYSPPVAAKHPQRVYWGDTHLHTLYSADAYSLGNHQLSAAEAYRIARGEEVTAESGLQVRLKRPLDFLAVTDHAEYLGAFYHAREGTPELMRSEIGKRWADYLADGEEQRLYEDFEKSVHAAGGEVTSSYALPDVFQRLVWNDVGATAERFYDLGRFTTIIGYEWTAMIDGNNLHRVVLFRDGSEKTSLVLPFSSQESPDPEDLWHELDHYESATGGRVLAIPHNSNVSNGMMFAETTISGEPLTADYARGRQQWEPLLEVTQVKGDSETHPRLSPTDEFADFERWDEANIMRTRKKEPEMFASEYARSALQLGLQHEARLGVNPFKFGMIGSTDSHTGLPTTEEDNFFGKFKGSEPSAARISSTWAPNLPIPNADLGASGLAAVWAHENTRESIFDAMERKEVYATTGTRITVRLFGGWDFVPNDVHRSNFAEIGYAGGVPMGGDLARGPDDGAPRFMVAASKDPDGANLDRIQVIKGWVDVHGDRHETIYDVALSGDRRVNSNTGTAPAVGNTVNVSEANYENSIGAADLSVVWTDPDFDPTQSSVYYVRVLEIPTPRWTAYDAKAFGVDMPDDVATVVQDRAYTSPIWYTP